MNAEPSLKTGGQKARGGVGESVAHESAVRHVTGGALYIDDLPMPPGSLYAHLVLSRWPRARIIGIDISAAQALPGVHAVVVAADIPGINDIGPAFPNEPLLPADTAEYVGHPLAAVAAETPEIARKAAALVKVEVEPLLAMLDLRDALTQNLMVFPPMEMSRGDPAPALAAAPHRFKGELEVGGQDHFYLETQIALAIPQEDRGMLVYSSTQHPTEVQHMVARLLDLPQSAVTCEVRRMGGGFGGKESQATQFAGIAALLAWKTGRAVKLWTNRDDDMVITGKRHDFLLQWDVGCDAEGRILGVDMVLAARAGWSVDLTPGVLSRALSHADNAYFYPAVRLRGFPCRTNTQSNTAFRGFGGPQGMMAAEMMMEQIARSLGRDPLAVRRLNFYGGAGRDLTPYHQPVRHFRLRDMVDQLVESSDYAARRRAVDEHNRTNPVIRRGIVLSPVKFGVSFNKIDMNQAGALVHVYHDGSILLSHGGTEMGQGLHLKVAQIVAETFSVDLDCVRIGMTSTDKVPNTSPTAASASSDLNGMAAKIAADEIKGRMAEVAARHFGVSVEEVTFENNQVRSGNHMFSFAELASITQLARVSLSATGFYRTPEIHYDPKKMRGSPFFYYANGVAVSEVAIDALTGEWKFLRADILNDVGNSLNPNIDRGQIEGAFIQGMGWLTLEELVWDKEGRLLTHAPSTYKIPTARDLPREFHVDTLKNAPNEAPTVFRSKAVGEPPLMLAISVWLAILDAVASFGGKGEVPRLNAPATPERILAAIADMRSRPTP